jgi:hypothetical protein
MMNVTQVFMRFAGSHKWPVRTGDVLEIWHDGEVVAEIDAALVLDIVAVEVRRARLGRVLAAQPITLLETERLSLPPFVSHAERLAGAEGPMAEDQRRRQWAKAEASASRRRKTRGKTDQECGVPQSETQAPCKLYTPCPYHSREG